MAFVKKGQKASRSNYGLFVSQRDILESKFITRLVPSAAFSPSVKLSAVGEQIINDWKSKWNNRDDALAKVVWNFEDCWHFFLLSDAL